VSHFREVCQYGKTHNQCRCGGQKTIRIIDCPTPGKHKPVDKTDEGMVEFLTEVKQGEHLHKTLHDRLMTVIEDRFWYLRTDLKKEVADSLEHEVSAWLISAAEEIRSNDATVHNRPTRGSSSDG